MSAKGITLLHHCRLSADLPASFDWMMQAQAEGLRHWLGDGWAKTIVDFRALVILEAAETLAELQPMSLTVDEPLTHQQYLKVRLEAVDTFINCLSWVSMALDPNLYRTWLSTRLAEEWLNQPANTQPIGEIPRSQLILAVSQFITSIPMVDLTGLGGQVRVILRSVIQLLKQLGVTLEDLQTLFVAKRALVAFRTNHGYVDPNARDVYQKFWNHRGERLADSVIAYDLAQQLDHQTPTFGIQLYRGLADAYYQTWGPNYGTN